MSSRKTYIPKDKVTKTVVPDKITECSLVVNDDICFSDDFLMTVMNIPNKVTGDVADKSIHGSMTLTHDQKVEIVEKLEETTNCDTQVCVVNTLIKKANNPVIKKMAIREKEDRFKIEGPRDTSLLSNFDIDSTLEQWKRVAFPHFFPYNFNMLDYEQTGASLAVIDLRDLYRDGYRCCACVINSDISSGRGKHWMALYANFDKDPWSVEFFNSSGNSPAFEWVRWMQKAKSQLESINGKNVEMIVATNIQHQHSRTECGVYSLFYIWARLHGIPYTYFHDNPIPDSLMFEMRQHLFSDDRFKPMKKFDYNEFIKFGNVKWE
jgi:hypothetical protein